jgi:hypothetical protein
VQYEDDRDDLEVISKHTVMIKCPFFPPISEANSIGRSLARAAQIDAQEKVFPQQRD